MMIALRKRFALWVRSLLFFLLATTSLCVLAQSPVSPRYPWDKRPDFCFNQSDTVDPKCQLNSWTDREETMRQIYFLYNTGQYTFLDRAMQEIMSSKNTFDNGESPASAAYFAFRRLMPAPGVSADHQVKIDQWKAIVPSSYFVPFVQSRFVYGNAWNVRGSGAAGSVSPESWELFRIRLQQAEKILLASPAALQETPIWHQLLLAILLDNPGNQSRTNAVFENAVKRWPRYFVFYEVMLTRLVPKWGGSWRQVESFIAKWSAQLAPSEGASTYARLYVSLQNHGVIPGETEMNWSKMRLGFEELTQRYPSREFKNRYASYACFARDKEAFGSAMRKLTPSQVDPDEWLSGHSYEACMRWAGV